MKNLVYYFFLVLSFGIVLTACDNTESYGDKRKAERKAISRFVSEKGITLITPDEFEQKDSVTDTTKNEFVYNSNTEVYFQIVENGKGKHAALIQSGSRRELICRFVEVNIETGDTLTTNLYDAENPDIMTVTNTSGQFSGSFTSGWMYNKYGSGVTSSSAVPEGWLAVMPYLKITRLSETDTPAKVRLIVPSTKGQYDAMSNVYPCYYEITFEGERQ